VNQLCENNVHEIDEEDFYSDDFGRLGDQHQPFANIDYCSG
jgi:hypothetical protein